MMLFPTKLNEDVPTKVAAIFICRRCNKVSTENLLAAKHLEQFKIFPPETVTIKLPPALFIAETCSHFILLPQSSLAGSAENTMAFFQWAIHTCPVFVPVHLKTNPLWLKRKQGIRSFSTP